MIALIYAASDAMIKQLSSFALAPFDVPDVFLSPPRHPPVRSVLRYMIFFVFSFNVFGKKVNGL